MTRSSNNFKKCKEFQKLHTTLAIYKCNRRAKESWKVKTVIVLVLALNLLYGNTRKCAVHCSKEDIAINMQSSF